MALSEFRSKFNNSDSETRFSMVKLYYDGSRFSRKSCVCGGKIEICRDGRAVCELCNTVFNDGGNTEGLIKVTNHYSDGTKEELEPKTAWEPRKGEHGHSHLNKFIKACRA
jgi:hypothetical protein